MQYREEIHNYIFSHKDEIVETLKELIKIPSVRGEASENAPFGIECARVLKSIEELYKNNGFETELDLEGGYLLSYFGKGKKTLGIFGHADVVPAGDGWTLTNPFEPIEKDGCIVGRGSMDDKSAIVMSLYCAKMLKELRIPFNSRLVMFAGANEETGMKDAQNYVAKHKIPDFSLVADSAFPLYRGNKGCVRFTVSPKEKLSKGFTINGGTASSVIGKVTAIMPFDSVLFDELNANENERLTVNKNGETIEIIAEGIAKHSALPEGGLSALAVLSEALLKCNSLAESDLQILKQLYGMSNCHFGEFFSLQNDDAEFGRLTCVLGKIETNESGEIIVHFNIRHGIGINKDFIAEQVTSKMNQIGFSTPMYDFVSVPHSIPKETKEIEALLNVYKDFTGDENAVTYINAGGTYIRHIKNAVEIGLSLGGIGLSLPAGHGSVHQPDEYISIEGLLNAIELTMLMLLKCDEIQKFS